jgi:aminoglycoside phosphotransferase (APT) family kinase protein
MTTPLHDDDADISGEIVRTVLRQQVPELAGLPLNPLWSTGSDNMLYRLGTEFVVRLRSLSSLVRQDRVSCCV